METDGLFGDLPLTEISPNVAVRRMITSNQAALLLGWSISLAHELVSIDNLERDDLGKPLGVWLSEALVDQLFDEDDEFSLACPVHGWHCP